MAVCKEKDYQWFILVLITSRSQDWMVKIYIKKHSCCPTYTNFKVLYKILAKYLKDIREKILTLIKLHKKKGDYNERVVY